MAIWSVMSDTVAVWESNSSWRSSKRRVWGSIRSKIMWIASPIVDVGDGDVAADADADADPDVDALVPVAVPGAVLLEDVSNATVYTDRSSPSPPTDAPEPEPAPAPAPVRVPGTVECEYEWE